MLLRPFLKMCAGVAVSILMMIPSAVDGQLLDTDEYLLLALRPGYSAGRFEWTEIQWHDWLTQNKNEFVILEGNFDGTTLGVTCTYVLNDTDGDSLFWRRYDKNNPIIVTEPGAASTEKGRLETFLFSYKEVAQTGNIATTVSGDRNRFLIDRVQISNRQGLSGEYTCSGEVEVLGPSIYDIASFGLTCSQNDQAYATISYRQGPLTTGVNSPCVPSGQLPVPPDAELIGHRASDETLTFLTRTTLSEIENLYDKYLGSGWSHADLLEMEVWTNSLSGCQIEMHSFPSNDFLAVQIRIVHQQRTAWINSVTYAITAGTNTIREIKLPQPLTTAWDEIIAGFPETDGWIMDSKLTIGIQPDGTAFLTMINGSTTYYVFFRQIDSGLTVVQFWEFETCGFQ